MRMQKRQSFIVIFFMLLISVFTWNCSEKKDTSKAPVVSKKISAPASTTSSTQSQESKTDDSEKKMAMKESDAGLSSSAARVYDPTKRLNPFTPLFGLKEKAVPDESAKKRKKRTPQTPLERISLDQLKLVAIIRASSGNRALVEDTVGKGYIIKNGTYIGLNSGMVTQINPESVIIEEEVENLKGEMVLQSTEMKLQKPAGE